MTDTKTQIDLDRFASKGEARAARSLIYHALNSGYEISVNDGDEWVVEASRDRKEILSALASTGYDFVRCAKLNEQGDKIIAVFSLVWGNDPSGEELIADYTDNDAADELYRAVYPRS